MRAGIGLISVSVPNSAKMVIAHRATEATYGSFDYGAQKTARKQLPACDGVAFGPGIGRSEGVEDQLIQLMHSTDGVLVLDADGLFYLNQNLDELSKRSSPAVLTPHLGEMGRLVGMSISNVEANRFELAKTFSKTYGVCLILKGPNTLVTKPDGQQWGQFNGESCIGEWRHRRCSGRDRTCFTLQHIKISEALCNAVYLHGFVADRLSQELSVQSGIRASDLTDAPPEMLGEILTTHA